MGPPGDSAIRSPYPVEPSLPARPGQDGRRYETRPRPVTLTYTRPLDTTTLPAVPPASADHHGAHVAAPQPSAAKARMVDAPPRYSTSPATDGVPLSATRHCGEHVAAPQPAASNTCRPVEAVGT